MEHLRGINFQEKANTYSPIAQHILDTVTSAAEWHIQGQAQYLRLAYPVPPPEVTREAWSRGIDLNHWTEFSHPQRTQNSDTMSAQDLSVQF